MFFLPVCKIYFLFDIRNKKILTNFEQSNVENIYAIGDVVDEFTANGNALELTPVAIQAGNLLANRLFGNSDVKVCVFFYHFLECMEQMEINMEINITLLPSYMVDFFV